MGEKKIPNSFKIGNAYCRQGEYEKAINAYQKAIKRNPHFSQYQVNLSFARCKLNGLNPSDKQDVFDDLCIEKYKKILSRPLPGRTLNSQEMLNALWTAYPTEAKNQILGLLFDSTKDKQLRASMAWELGRWYLFKEQYSDAVAFARFAKQTNQGLFDKKCELLFILSLQKMNRLRESQSAAESALSSLGDDPDILLALSNSFPEDQNRLQAINRIFIKNNLIPLRLKSSSNKLSINSIIGDKAAVAKKVKTYRNLYAKKVSVLIPAYNASATILNALDSLLQQTWPSLEIIVADDCSTDNTYGLVKSLAEKDDRIVVVRAGSNRGAYHARNLALSHARGDFITTHDSDDWSHPQKIELQVSAFLKDNSLKGVMAHWVRCSTSMHFTSNWRLRNRLITPTFSSFMVPREVVEEVGGWDEVRVGADSEFIRQVTNRYGKKAIKKIMPNVPLAFAAKDEGSLTGAKATNVSTINYGLRHMYAEVCEFYRRSSQNKDAIRQNAFNKIKLCLPTEMLQKCGRVHEYDFVLISDFSSDKFGKLLIELGGCLSKNGKKVGLLNVPRFGAPAGAPIASFYKLAINPNVDVLVHTDNIECECVILGAFGVTIADAELLPTLRARTAQFAAVFEGDERGSFRRPAFIRSEERSLRKRFKAPAAVLTSADFEPLVKAMMGLSGDSSGAKDVALLQLKELVSRTALTNDEAGALLFALGCWDEASHFLVNALQIRQHKAAFQTFKQLRSCEAQLGEDSAPRGLWSLINSTVRRDSESAFELMLYGSPKDSRVAIDKFVESVFEHPELRDVWRRTFSSLLQLPHSFPSRISCSGPRPMNKIFVAGFKWSGSGAVFDHLRGFDNVRAVHSELQIIEGSGGALSWVGRETLNRSDVFRVFVNTLLGVFQVNSAEDYKTSWHACKKSLTANDAAVYYAKQVSSCARELVDCVAGESDREIKRRVQRNQPSCVTVIEWILDYLYSDNGAKSNEVVLFDNVIHAYNVEAIRLFQNAKILCVSRDPRSTYFARKWEDNGFVHDVSQFADEFKRDRERFAVASLDLKVGGSRLIEIGFEEFVSSAAYRAALDRSLGVQAETSSQSSFFDPEVSMKNIDKHMHYSYQKEIEVIERQLAEYCVDVDGFIDL